MRVTERMLEPLADAWSGMPEQEGESIDYLQILNPYLLVPIGG